MTRPETVVCPYCGHEQPNNNRIISGAYYQYLCIGCGKYYPILQTIADYDDEVI